jgi:hypothetical protein
MVYQILQVLFTISYLSSGHGVLKLNMDEERVNINSEACCISHLSSGLLSPLRLPRRKLASEMPDGPPSGNPMKQKREFLDPEHIPSFYLIQFPVLDMQQNVEDDDLNARWLE